MRTIANAKDELEAMMHGTSLDKLKNLYGVFTRAARDFLLDIDPEETRRTFPLAENVESDDYDYVLPTDLKSDHVIHIYTTDEDSTEIQDSFEQDHEKKFQLNKKDFSFDIIWDNGTKKMRLSRDVNAAAGTAYTMSYYSNCLFKTPDVGLTLGTWKEATTDDTDIVMLDTHSFNVYLYKVAEHAAAQLRQTDDVSYYRQQYEIAKAEYKKQNGSDRIKKSQSYYDFEDHEVIY